MCQKCSKIFCLFTKLHNVKKRSKLPLMLIYLSYLIALVGVAFYIAENNFFDQFFYRKSLIHGYHLQYTNNPISKKILGLNDQGFRTTKLEPKKDNEILLMVVGDSNVWGWGVRNSQRFTRILQRQLSLIKPTRILELAKGGTNILSHEQTAKYYEQVLHPDIVIFVFFENDLTISISQTEQIVNLTGGNKPIIYDVEANSSESDYFSKVLGSYDINTANYQLFRDLISTLNKKWIYFMLSYYPRSPHELLAEQMLQQNQLTTINVDKLFYSKYEALATANNGKKQPSLAISAKEGHPGPIAHQLFAQTLFDYIVCHPDFPYYVSCK